MDTSVQNHESQTQKNIADTDSIDTADHTVPVAENLLDILREAIAHNNLDSIVSDLKTLHPADYADLLEYLNRDERQLFLEGIKYALPGDVLTELDGNIRDEVLLLVPDPLIHKALAEMETDDAVDIIEDLDPEDAKRILANVPEQARWKLEDALTYSQYSAGRLMSRDLVALPENFMVGQAIDLMRAAHDLPSDFYVIYLVILNDRT